MAVALLADDGGLSLESAIEQLIKLGEKDPLTIARRLADLHGGDWVARELASHWEEILAEIARQKLGNERRASIVSIGDRSKAGRVTKRDAVLASLFLPSKGYIVLGDATLEDLAEAEGYRRRLASGLNLWADWYRDTRELCETQGVDRVRDLRGSLPPLPPKGELAP
jgi:hypothetical protein